jgi:hypothetical protein
VLIKGVFTKSRGSRGRRKDPKEGGYEKIPAAVSHVGNALFGGCGGRRGDKAHTGDSPFFNRENE